jgi:hypothetical protein
MTEDVGLRPYTGSHTVTADSFHHLTGMNDQGSMSKKFLHSSVGLLGTWIDFHIAMAYVAARSIGFVYRSLVQ